MVAWCYPTMSGMASRIFCCSALGWKVGLIHLLTAWPCQHDAYRLYMSTCYIHRPYYMSQEYASPVSAGHKEETSTEADY